MTGRKEIVPAAEGQIITPKMAKYVDRITQRWTRGVLAIIETGQLLSEARADCAHGEWQDFVEQLPFGSRHAYTLMAIAEWNPNRRRVSHLPSDTYTLYQLSRLPEERFEKLLEDGVINPAMKRQDASAETRAEARAKDEARVANLKPVKGKFKTLILDPPWDSHWYSKTAGHPPYATMSIDEILALPVAGWAENKCHLYLWTPNNFLPLAVQAMKDWGFAHKSVLTWNKKTKDGTKPKNGMGHYFRNDTEQVLFGTRGKLMTRVCDIKTAFESPVGAHSEKPDVFYDIVRRASYPAFGEGFQGKARKDFENLFEGNGDG